MDFSRYEQVPRYQAFLATVREFLDENLTEDVQAEALKRHDQHHPDFFRALGRQGWIIPDLTPEQGGAGLDYREIEILDAELERRQAPIINVSTTRMIFPSVLRFGQDEIRDEVVRQVTGGETALTLGYTEPGGGSDIAEVKTRAKQQADGSWLVSGSKVYTTGAHHARYTFLLANTDPEARKGRGLTMFLLPLDLPGVRIDALWTLGERTNTSFYGDVVVEDRYRLGEVNGGWEVLQGPLEAEHAIGARDTERAHLDAGTLYGRRLAHALRAGLDWAATSAPNALDDTALTTLAELARMVEESQVTAGLTGRVAGAENYITGTSMLMDLLGEDALVSGSGPGGLVQKLHRDAQVSTVYGGTTEVFRNLIGRELGLPKQAYRQ